MFFAGTLANEEGVPLPMGCNFEKFDKCGFVMTSDADFTWRVANGTTNTPNTGPESGYLSDNYIYMEASSRREHDNAM